MRQHPSTNRTASMGRRMRSTVLARLCRSGLCVYKDLLLKVHAVYSVMVSNIPNYEHDYCLDRHPCDLQADLQPGAGQEMSQLPIGVQGKSDLLSRQHDSHVSCEFLSSQTCSGATSWTRLCRGCSPSSWQSHWSCQDTEHLSKFSPS